MVWYSKEKEFLIPTSLRLDMIKRIHSSHIGVEGCLRRARASLYWPWMNSQVKDFIRRCETCRTYEKKQQRETLISHEIPSRPWSKVGVDLMKCRDKDYLVTVDYYSNCWEIDYVENTFSSTIINKTKIALLSSWDTGYCIQWQWTTIWLVWIQKICLFVGIQTRNIVTIISTKQWESRTSS
jgi:hypothetical protein